MVAVVEALAYVACRGGRVGDISGLNPWLGPSAPPRAAPTALRPLSHSATYNILRSLSTSEQLARGKQAG